MKMTPAAKQIDDLGRGSWRDLALWTSALIIVVGTQASGAYWYANQQPESAPESGVPEAIMLELAPISTSVDNAVPDLPPDQQTMVEQKEITPSELPDEEALEPPPEPVVEPQDVPPDVEEPPPEPEPDPLPEPVPEPMEPPPEPLPEPVEPVIEAPKEIIPDIVEAPEPAVIAPMPVIASASIQERRKRPKPAPKPPAQQAAPRTSAPAPSEAPRAAVAASAQLAAAQQAAPLVSPARWQSKLMSHLNRRKQYRAVGPKPARRGCRAPDLFDRRRGQCAFVRHCQVIGFRRPRSGRADHDRQSVTGPCPAR